MVMRKCLARPENVLWSYRGSSRLILRAESVIWGPANIHESTRIFVVRFKQINNYNIKLFEYEAVMVKVWEL